MSEARAVLDTPGGILEDESSPAFMAEDAQASCREEHRAVA